MLRAKGFSLVELMVSLVAGLIVLGVVASLFVSVIKGSSVSMRLTRLNQELQAIGDIVSRDLQRAGYFSLAANNFQRIDSNGNGVIDAAEISAAINTDFVFDPSHDLVAISTSVPTYDCVLIRYDDNNNGALESGDFFGYRYNGTSQAVEVGEAGTAWTTAANQSCSTGDWEAISDSNDIAITDMTLTLSPVGALSAAVRSVELVLVGQHKQNTALSLRIERTIKLKNDYYSK